MEDALDLPGDGVAGLDDEDIGTGQLLDDRAEEGEVRAAEDDNFDVVREEGLDEAADERTPLGTARRARERTPESRAS